MLLKQELYRRLSIETMIGRDGNVDRSWRIPRSFLYCYSKNALETWMPEGKGVSWMNRPRELFVPARITNVHTYDPGEVRKVAFTLPEIFEVDGRPVPVRDRMRPGSAFLVKPFGVRTQKYRRRMYTRTNCSDESPRVLETIINDTHKEKADTSPWWQTDDLVQRCRTGWLDRRVREL